MMPSPCAWIGFRDVSVHTVPGVTVTAAARAAGAKSPTASSTAAPRSGSSRLTERPQQSKDVNIENVNITPVRRDVNGGVPLGRSRRHAWRLPHVDIGQ